MRDQQRPWFYVAVAVQLLILAMVPAQKLLAAAVGKPVLLKVAPVDPYNILSGYYLTLSYEIAHVDGDDIWQLAYGADVYAMLLPDPDGTWRRISLTKTWPRPIPDGALVLRGRKFGPRIEYGIESYFVPEAKRDAVADDLRQHSDQARVEVRVDRQGNAMLKRLLIADRVYAF